MKPTETDSHWKSLYRVGGVAALIAAAGSTWRSYASLSICLPVRSRPATYGTGRRSAPGRATWPRGFNLLCPNERRTHRGRQKCSNQY